MIEITPTKEQIEQARQEASNLGSLSGSITRGAGNVAGFLGEILVAELLAATRHNTYDFDMLDKNNIKIDVKTKRCTSAPKDFYDCVVPAHGTKQACDDYVFVRILENLKKAWILGRKPKKEFYANAIYRKKGDVDESCGFVYKASCYVLPMNQLDGLRVVYESESSTT